MPDSKKFNMSNKEVINLLRMIKKTPEMTQRELALRLGISLGKVNFLIKALVQKGIIKVNNFKKSNNKSAYLYILTPRGIEEKSRVTYRFLKRKIEEYRKLKEEIRELQEEVEKTSHTIRQ